MTEHISEPLRRILDEAKRKMEEREAKQKTKAIIEKKGKGRTRKSRTTLGHDTFL